MILENNLDVISQVESFYNSAWDKLILTGAIAFGVIGILVPIIVQWYQNNRLKVSEKLLKKEIEDQANDLKTLLLEEIKSKFTEKEKHFEEKIQRLNASANAKTFHLQGNSQLESHDYKDAFLDYYIASEYYLHCEDFTNLQSMLEAMLNQCLPEMTSQDMLDLKITDDVELENFTKEINKKDEKGAFVNLLKEIKLTVTKLPEERNTED